MEYKIYMDTPIGKIVLKEDHIGISALGFHPKEEEDGVIENKTPLLKKAKKQLEEYFAGRRKVFDLPLSLNGTKFQRAVWDALYTIPYGELRSYKDIAIQVDCPKGFRAVGMANHVNPVSIIVPCHRVVGSNGTLTGYGGGLDVKKYLLNLETENDEKARKK